MLKEYLICPVQENEIEPITYRWETPHFKDRNKSCQFGNHKKNLISSIEDIITEGVRIRFFMRSSDAEEHGNPGWTHEYELKQDLWNSYWIDKDNTRHPMHQDIMTKENSREFITTEKFKEWDSLSLKITLEGITINLFNWLDIRALDCKQCKHSISDMDSGYCRQKMFLALDLDGTEENIQKYYKYFKDKLGTYIIDKSSLQSRT